MDDHGDDHAGADGERNSERRALAQSNQELEGEAFGWRAGDKPVAAHGKDVGNGEAKPCSGNNLAVDGPMLQGNVVDAHPEHHTKTHDKGEQQALSFVDRHKGRKSFLCYAAARAKKTGRRDGVTGTSSRPPAVRASATTYVVELP